MPYPQLALRPRTWLLLALIMLFGALVRFADLESAPVGGHGDVAWKGINALDWLDSGVFPYYVWELYAPEPTIVILSGLAMPLTGVSYLAGRTVTAVLGVLFSGFLFGAVWWLMADAPYRRRELAALLAALVVAASLHANYLSRLGMRAAIFPVQCALLTWLVAWAWNRGGWWRWALAGIVLGWMQYTYIPARLFPLVLALWCAHVWLADRERWRARWRGWLVMLAVAVILSLPNIVMFINTPESFTARADTGTAETGGWIWDYDTSAEGGMIAVLLKKTWLELRALGINWNGPYSMIGNPMLPPLFFIGFLFGLGLLIARPRRIETLWPLLAIPIMFFTDLISGAVVDIHGLRQTGVLPYVFILSGVGLAAGWEWALAQVRAPFARHVITGTLIAFALLPALTGLWRYLGEHIPAEYANPATGWRTEQIDVDISRRIIAQPDRAYLVPFDEYNRANIAFLTSQVYRQRHSALDADGILTIPDPPEEVVIVTASDPERIRHDGRLSVWDTRLWVLLRADEALFLPPFTPEQEQTVSDLLNTLEPERLADRSQREIAQFYSVPTPTGLFAPRDVLTFPVQAEFSLPDGTPEIRLVGYDLPAKNLTPGAITYITLYWQTLRPPSEDYEIFAQIWNDAGDSLAGAHDFPNGGMYRTRIWRADEITVTHHWLRLPEDLPTGAYSLAAGLYRVLQNEPLVAAGANANANNDLALSRDLRVMPEFTALQGTPFIHDLRFGDLLTVAAFDMTLAGETVAFDEAWPADPGAGFTLDLHWDVLARSRLDYSLFLHLTAEDDAPPLAQADIPLGTQGLPTGVWYPGDQWHDSVTLMLPDDLPSGTYTLWLGIYYYADNTRLTPVLDGDAQPEGRVRIGHVLIE